MKITMVHGQNHKGSTYHIGKMLADKLGGEVTEFFLPKDFGHFCIGCNQCIVKDEKLCPYYKELKPLTDAIDSADVIILTSPVYVYHCTGSMKHGWITMATDGCCTGQTRICFPNRESVFLPQQVPERNGPTKIWQTVCFSGGWERYTGTVLPFMP